MPRPWEGSEDIGSCGAGALSRPYLLRSAMAGGRPVDGVGLAVADGRCSLASDAYLYPHGGANRTSRCPFGYLHVIVTVECAARHLLTSVPCASPTPFSGAAKEGGLVGTRRPSPPSAGSAGATSGWCPPVRQVGRIMRIEV